MSNNQNDSYANLPDELLEDILEDAPKIANKIKPLFEELHQQRKTLHQTLDDNNLICRVGDLENPPSPSVAAVDGGQAIEKSIGADTLIAVAVGVEGLVREDKRKWGSVQYKNWQDVLPHSSESNPKVTRGAMTALELLVISKTPHDVVISDPVIGLGIRDQYIGWTKEQKLQRLYNCMTAYILGAVPPYNLTLGSKLIALCLMFPEVREVFYNKYKDKISLISGENKQAHLLYIDTLGAFGKSSIYNRLNNWKFIGYTKGQSHLHITANGSWELIKQVVSEDFFNTYKFGQGPNWKMRVLKEGLRELGFSADMVSIGWQRGYYSCPLAENWQEYLVGESDIPQWKPLKKDDLIEYWKNRWIIPRLEKLDNALKVD